MTGNRRPRVTRPRRSNSLKDIRRLLSVARVAYDDEGRTKLVSHASYFVNPMIGERTIFTRLRLMNLELLGTGQSVTPSNLSLIDQYRPPACF